MGMRMKITTIWWLWLLLSWLPYRRSLLGNWSSASKYEQMVLEVLKAAEKKDEKAIEESEKKIKEYNTKVMMKMSMRSILGWAVCLSVLSPVLFYQLVSIPSLYYEPSMTSTCQIHCIICRKYFSMLLCSSLRWQFPLLWILSIEEWQEEEMSTCNGNLSGRLRKSIMTRKTKCVSTFHVCLLIGQFQ